MLVIQTTRLIRYDNNTLNNTGQKYVTKLLHFMSPALSELLYIVKEGHDQAGHVVSVGKVDVMFPLYIVVSEVWAIFLEALQHVPVPLFSLVMVTIARLGRWRSGVIRSMVLHSRHGNRKQ